MGQYDDLSSSRAYQENVALPDQRAFAQEAEARQVLIEQLVAKESGRAVGYRCVHEGMQARTPQAIVVGLDSGLQVLVDVCDACMEKIKQARSG